MKILSELKRVFCVGPAGVLFTLVFWFVAYTIEKMVSFPKMDINPIFRIALVSMFTIDAVYLFFGSLYYLKPLERGKKLVKSGPFKYIRHPLYSLFIYSFTALIALWFKSWFLLLTVVPLSLIWSRLVQKEEKYMLKKFGIKYRNYMEKTGQFLPSWKVLKEEVESNS
ncbi:MAG: isoprenylcysteine carboxylmethyltransferase family protein [Candidatus Marinimicrobia bacterium]|nr:isoprenylcysteine carboxylmethyltransferase family protein [Candidatus Neomarinimicrobiota bacterium]